MVTVEPAFHATQTRRY